ncbi:ABC transporter ATP-binding protein [Asanoa sp. WMMD1127]|uniref:ABC transporter ATP-binding protein n=1 Tax=Asanoa sp. WMMD1127 TaxID=3016107 RepID=UPI002416C864|nr:ABC transporter ATP-binding protein [Asanoa sp. WMMD1127]MDG4825279.1 ABC transporter ATP-binding protein [Asanoa sp. WMMD1127]
MSGSIGGQVVFTGIDKYFGDFPAVVDLNLTIQSGEFFTLLGPSGSGKTTTLRMLAGLEAASAGEITIDGRSVTNVVPEKRNVGLVFQNYALFPHMTVTDNIRFPLSMRRTPKAEMPGKVQRVLEMTQLEDFRGRYPRELSGGQQQRVALARAFVYDPSILLMDEPLGALDRNLRDRLRLELKSLQQRIGATVLYVTHDQDEALALSDRVGVMHKGRLQQVASPVEMYERPVNSFVAQFLGDSVCLPAARVERGAHSVLDVEGLGKVVVDKANDMADTDQGVLVVRPEKFRVAAAEPDATDLNRIPGVVEASVYLGSVVHLYIRADSGARVQVHAPAGDARVEAGARRWLTWSPTDSLFLPVVT